MYTRVSCQQEANSSLPKAIPPSAVLSGNSIKVSAVLANASSPMSESALAVIPPPPETSASRNSTVVSSSLSLNALPPILFTEAGILTEAIPVPLKANSPICSKAEAASRFTEVRPASIKADCPMEIRLLPFAIVTDVRVCMPLNALLPIVPKLAGRLTDTRSLARKASSPMETTPSGSSKL